MIKKYVDFINEAEEVEAGAQVQSEKETDASDSYKFMDVQEEIKSMIEKTIKNSGGEYSSFVQSFLKNPEDVKVDGFINDSDLYDFYLKASYYNFLFYIFLSHKYENSLIYL
jgi:hypothetical protein